MRVRGASLAEPSEVAARAELRPAARRAVVARRQVQRAHALSLAHRAPLGAALAVLVAASAGGGHGVAGGIAAIPRPQVVRRRHAIAQENLRDAGAPSSARAEGWAAAPGGRESREFSEARAGMGGACGNGRRGGAHQEEHN